MNFKINKIIYLILFLVTEITFTYGQIIKEKAIYRGFPDGVYLNSGQFILRKPFIAKADMLTRNKSIPTSIHAWIKSDSLFYKDTTDQKLSLNIDSVWGVYENGTLYIQKNRLIHKVNTLGMLSMFYESFPLVKAPFNPVASDQSRKDIPKMLNLETGEIIPYTVDAMKIFLKNHDETLNIQYSSLKKNKIRRKQLFHFIELYNEFHPLF